MRSVRRKLVEWFVQVMSTRRQRIMAVHFMIAAGVRAVTFERDGYVWSLRPQDDDIELQTFLDGGYQPAEIQALLDWTRRSGMLAGSRNVLIDAGANIGTTCIPFVRQAGCRALAIEPVAENFRFLRNNVESNGLSGRILLANKAVSRNSGSLKMYLTERRSGGNFVARDDKVKAPEFGFSGYEEVAADTLTDRK